MDAEVLVSVMLSTNGQFSTVSENDKAFRTSGRTNHSCFSVDGTRERKSATLFFLPLLYFMTKS